MLSGAENLSLTRGITPKGLGLLGSDFHGKKFPKISFVSSTRFCKIRTITPKCSFSSTSRPASQPRFIQHKKEAFWFYRFLSIVYDHVINPGHWTEDMRDEALEPADLSDRNMIVVDVGGGTGFTTLGIVKHVDAKNVTILDQSPHQLAKAKQKEPLKECKIIEGDAEDLPFPTDYADRYVSAGRCVSYVLPFTCTEFLFFLFDALLHCIDFWLFYDFVAGVMVLVMLVYSMAHACKFNDWFCAGVWF